MIKFLSLEIIIMIIDTVLFGNRSQINKVKLRIHADDFYDFMNVCHSIQFFSSCQDK